MVTDEQVRLLMSLLKQGTATGDRSGQGGIMSGQAFGAQVRAIRSNPLAGEGGAHVAHAV